MKALTQVKDATGAETRNSQEINSEKAAAEAINKVKQDLATKEIEQRLKQEKQNKRLNETQIRTRDRREFDEQEQLQHLENDDWKTIWHHKNWGNNHVKNHSVSHEVTRKLSEPSDQTIIHTDVYADYLSAMNPQTPSRALRAKTHERW